MTPDAYGTPEMFELEAVLKSKPKRKYVKPAGYGKCPSCTALKVALIPGGAHLVWKPHKVRTWKGTPLDCQSSGVALCTLPEPATNAFNTEPLECRCQTKAHPFVR